MDAWSLSSERVLPRGRKARALLAFLAMSNGRSIPRAELSALLWPRSAEEQARGSLRQAVHELALSLLPAGPGLLHAGRDELALTAASIWVDALEVERATMEQPWAFDLVTSTLLPEMNGLSLAFDAWLVKERRKLSIVREALARRFLDLKPDSKQEDAPPQTLRFEVENESVGDAGLGAGLDAARRVEPQQVSSTSAHSPALNIAETSWLDDKKRKHSFATSLPRRGIRLGVPPLAILGASDDQHLATGLADEITAGLSRFRWLFLADPATLATVSDPVRTAAEMELDGLLLGSVRRVGSRVRIAMRLVDPCACGTTSGAVLWTARFDSVEGDQLALQDEIATAVVARLDPELLLIEAKRAFARSPADASAHELVLRAIPALHALERTAFEKAGQFLEEAIRRDPEYATAHAWAACWHVFQVGQGWAPDHDVALARAGTLATRAARLDPFDALALTMQGHVLAYLHHRPEEGCSLHERALALNPNLAMAWVFSGLAHCYCGRHEEALERLARYARLAPLHPLAFFFDAARLVPLMLLGRHEEAIDAARAVSILNTDFSFPLRPWLASLGWLGLKTEADVVRSRLLAIEPSFTVSSALRRAPLRTYDQQTYAEGLRRAGLPED